MSLTSLAFHNNDSYCLLSIKNDFKFLITILRWLLNTAWQFQKYCLAISDVNWMLHYFTFTSFLSQASLRPLFSSLYADDLTAGFTDQREGSYLLFRSSNLNCSLHLHLLLLSSFNSGGRAPPPIAGLSIHLCSRSLHLSPLH